MKEIFIPVKGFNGYEISNMGRLKSYRRKKPFIHKPRFGASGPAYQLRKSGNSVQVRAAILVAWHFLDCKTLTNSIEHKNGIMTDCRAENLKLKYTKFEVEFFDIK